MKNLLLLLFSCFGIGNVLLGSSGNLLAYEASGSNNLKVETSLAFSLSTVLEVNQAETEPNNSFTEANTLAINTTATGSIGINGDASDWFKFTTTYNGKITFTLTPQAGLDTYIDMYDTNGSSHIKQCSVCKGIGEIDVLEFANLAAGTYYVRISSGGSGTYSLKNEFVPTLLPDGNDTEPNDAFDKAQVISINTTTTGQIGYFGNQTTDGSDWYKITTPNDGTIVFTITPESTLDSYIDMYDTNGSSHIRQCSVCKGLGETDLLEFANLAAGTYYIRISSGGHGSYTLQNAFEATSINPVSETELNNTFATANNFSLYTQKTGHIGYFGKGETDNADFFKFTTSELSNFSLTALPDATLDIYINMYNADQGHIKMCTTCGGLGENDQMVYENLAAGTYYIQVQGGGYGSYTLKTPLSAADETEPNNIFTEATELTLNNVINGAIGISGDINDWFSITTTTDGKLLFQGLPENQLDLYMDFYDSDGTTHIKQCTVCGNTGQKDEIEYPNLKAGTYFINLRGSTSGTYTLKNTFTPTSIQIVTESEPNNTVANANGWLLNTQKTGHLGFYGNKETDNVDYFKFETTSSGTISITGTPDATLDLYFDLYNATETHIKQCTTCGGLGMNEAIYFENLPAGIYYLRIGGGGFGSYTIINQFAGAPSIATVGTGTATEITENSAKVNGNVITDGNASVTNRGMVWAKTTAPTISSNSGKTENGTGIGEFIADLTGLQANTQYFARAYATNSVGTAYGNEISFTTLEATVQEFAGGTGTETDPWLIATPDQLNNMRNYCGTANKGKFFKQIAHIDLNVAPYNSAEGWSAIGSESSYFMNTFNGNSFEIIGLTINRTTTSHQGLFGSIENALLTNIKITGANITGTGYLGILVGWGINSAIDFCTAQGTVIGTEDNVGGLIGYLYKTAVTNSNSNSEVTGRDYVGGLLGNNNESAFSKCYSIGKVTGNAGVGGLIGRNYTNTIINECYSTAAVTAYEKAGGLVGESALSAINNCYTTGKITAKSNGPGFGGFVGYNSSVIISCYSIGEVASTAYDTGGFVGSNSGGTYTNCFWDKTSSKIATSFYATGLATADMIKQASFTSWNFTDFWKINEAVTYPYLKWQVSPGTHNYPAGEITYEINFTVKDKDNFSISTAVITFNGTTYNAGVYKITGIKAGTHEYSVAKNTYKTVTGSVTVTNANVNLDIVLQPATYSVTFAVKDEQNTNLTDAIITFDGKDYAAGVYTIENILPGMYLYKVTKNGYKQITETVTITDANKTVEAILIQNKYFVNFTVTSGVNAVSSATITINNQTLTTDNLGKARIELPNGNYGYTVSKTGYATLSNQVTVENTDKNVPVSLINTGIAELSSNKIKVFPNPVAGEFTIDSDEGINSVSIENLLGQRVLYVEAFGNATMSISTNELKTGIYHVRIELATGNTSIHKIIKN
ncbi:MAG TPA: hypothetical protein DCQ31_16600 [Bacteroidales bacterium]|nr:hypothetical protein [Bacteroidales bacterium]